MIIKAVVFDLDDTLISEMQYVKSGYKAISKILADKLCIDSQYIFDTLMRLFYNSPKNVFNRILDKLKVKYSTEDIMELVEAYRNHLPEIQFYDDVLPCLKQLKDRGMKMGIISDGYISTQQNKLKVLNANDYFDYIIMTEELGREFWKPHPKAYEIMSAALNVEFNNMIYVGDNPEKDFYISSIYPIYTIRIIRGNSIYKDRAYFKGVKEVRTIHNLKELAEVRESQN